ncbi:glycoside hydrolase family 130 protein [Pontiella sulfatireligans]|uniref:1,4-beta-mannosyl-N-acetylglucosamine phosphorylase n=1 Tax=Pontiella sulfatireligans TaxID=2750658 RepID=A0A6C2UDB2_9BACT|nr:glycoside hydrolase family 130 protein [Pontiella sulfatireligans]VGO18140.1 1,4-beta-mannosyl-N-acetylglucosamine phosphorylase [Pontiella sulfatireligans]
MNPKVKRKSERILGDPRRVIARPNLPGSPERIERIMQRVIALPEETAAALLEQVMLDFAGRHRDIDHIFMSHLKAVKDHLPRGTLLSGTQHKLLGAYFTMEYSIESAALFNPSIVPHPDQSGLNAGELRFILSLRATGEGHISSIVFRSGILNAENLLAFDPISDYVETPALHLDADYDRHLFELKLNEMEACNETTAWVLDQLPDNFTYAELEETVADFREEHCPCGAQQNEALELIDWLAHSNYETTFRAEFPLSERVIFPVSKNESSGIEDARFVRFTDDDGEVTYYATYTAYNGFSILPQLIETKDFVTFNVITLNGRAVHNKGMALFPHKINGRYVMLSRQDGENNHIMFSDHLHFWQESAIIQEPERPWEFIQVGNCGSPLETEAGWLVLTHGVGPMRQYCIGAMLLDLENPAKVIARLEEPLLTPHEQEREGYVPNVVYSCGAIIHNNELVIPYAMSDVHSGIATVAVDELIGSMQPLA